MEYFRAQAGDVLHLWCNICTPQKHKFFVVAYAGPRLRYMLINSEPAKFQQENPELMRHQLKLSVQEHSFLAYESYLDCSQILGGPSLDELADMQNGGQRIYIGAIGPTPRQALREVVVGSRVLTERDKRMLLESW